MVPLRYNLRSMFVRKTTTIATILGIGLVVLILAAAMMLESGIKRTMGASGREDYAVVLRLGSDAELSSTIETPSVGIILAAPGVKRGSDGSPLGSGEVVVVIAADKVGDEGQFSNVTVRGVQDNVFAFRPHVKIVEGRAPKPGTDEVVVGERVRGRFKGLELGQTFELKKNRPVTVVGIMHAGGASFESEVWADIDTIRSAFGREAMVSSVTVALESTSAFDAFRAAVENDKQLGLDVERENIFFENQSEATAQFISVVGFIIAFFFIGAAMIGAFITMNTAVASRQREIGTLRAIGFKGRSVLFSFLLEAVCLSLFGAAVGVLGAFFLSFMKFSMMNFATWSEIVFDFDLTPNVIVSAVITGAIMGLLGGFIPALRAARVKPVDAMRA